MQPKLEKIPYSTSSIVVKREISAFMDYPWHYHPEFEIIFVEKSYGIRLMGSHIGNFSDGDLVFISSNLPHVWKNDNNFYQNDENLKVDAYVIHFREDALGEKFFSFPEFTNIRKLFVHGQQGVLIKGKDVGHIYELIKKVYLASGIERLLLFLKTLEEIARIEDYELLSSPGYVNSVNLVDTQRINTVVEFLMTNYTRDISVDEVAKLVKMNKSSFCRYFKSRTHKTCSQFLNEIRITHACKLLVNDNLTASEVCYETGYNNISHFTRQFKLITGTTTKNYTRTYLKSGDE